MLKFLLPLALVGSFGATAQAPLAAADRTVSFADLNLASPAGVRTLDRRLSRAIDRACGVDRDERIRALVAAAEKCRVQLQRQLAPSRAAAIGAAGSTAIAAAR